MTPFNSFHSYVTYILIFSTLFYISILFNFILLYFYFILLNLNLLNLVWFYLISFHLIWSYFIIAYVSFYFLKQAFLSLINSVKFYLYPPWSTLLDPVLLCPGRWQLNSDASQSISSTHLYFLRYCLLVNRYAKAMRLSARQENKRGRNEAIREWAKVKEREGKWRRERKKVITFVFRFIGKYVSVKKFYPNIYFLSATIWLY